MRKYKSGTKWCIWRWTEVKNDKGVLYLKRLHLLKTPWFSIYLHWIYTTDPYVTRDFLPVLHSHPVDFLSIILRGSYTEITDIIWDCEHKLFLQKYNSIKWWNWIPHNKKHHISFICFSNTTVTLCFAGPARQKWGYYLMNEDTKQFDYVQWNEYKHV
jgi:hypothetical protein